MARDSVWITVVERTGLSGACDLCATDAAWLESLVVVRHAHGGAAQFAACTTCTRGMRRIAAVVGGDSALTGAATAADRSDSPSALSPTPPNVEHAELLAELTEYFTARDGKRYLVRVWGGPRPAGTWAGWLEFVSLDGTEIKRTGQETSQPDRDKVLYWTTGLGPAYFEGAFARAR